MDDPARGDRRLGDDIPRNRRHPYDGRDIIVSVMDEDSFFEIGNRWGREVIGGLVRIDGNPVGVLEPTPASLEALS